MRKIEGFGYSVFEHLEGYRIKGSGGCLQARNVLVFFKWTGLLRQRAFTCTRSMNVSMWNISFQTLDLTRPNSTKY